MRPTALRRLLILVVAVAVVGCGSPTPPPTLRVGATTDTQTTLLANIYAAGLRYYGTAADVETVDDPMAALDSGSVSVVPGTISIRT
jgi:hypothetical protein